MKTAKELLYKLENDLKKNRAFKKKTDQKIKKSQIKSVKRFYEGGK